MPRRTRPPRRRRPVPEAPESSAAEPNYEQLAADLVRRGVASPRILAPSKPIRRQPSPTQE